MITGWDRVSCSFFFLCFPAPSLTGSMVFPWRLSLEHSHLDQMHKHICHRENRFNCFKWNEIKWKTTLGEVLISKINMWLWCFKKRRRKFRIHCEGEHVGDYTKCLCRCTNDSFGWFVGIVVRIISSRVDVYRAALFISLQWSQLILRGYFGETNKHSMSERLIQLLVQ